MSVVIDIAKASGIMHGKIQRLGLGDDIGSLEKVNVQGEEVQKLDEVATEVFLSALAKSRKVAVVGCEERDDPVFLGQDQAPYVVNINYHHHHHPVSYTHLTLPTNREV